jgi:hypothetical protein
MCRRAGKGIGWLHLLRRKKALQLFVKEEAA